MIDTTYRRDLRNDKFFLKLQFISVQLLEEKLSSIRNRRTLREVTNVLRATL